MKITRKNDEVKASVETANMLVQDTPVTEEEFVCEECVLPVPGEPEEVCEECILDVSDEANVRNSAREQIMDIISSLSQFDSLKCKEAIANLSVVYLDLEDDAVAI